MNLLKSIILWPFKLLSLIIIVLIASLFVFIRLLMRIILKKPTFWHVNSKSSKLISYVFYILKWGSKTYKNVLTVLLTILWIIFKPIYALVLIVFIILLFPAIELGMYFVKKSSKFPKNKYENHPNLFHNLSITVYENTRQFLYKILKPLFDIILTIINILLFPLFEIILNNIKNKEQFNQAKYLDHPNAFICFVINVYERNRYIIYRVFRVIGESIIAIIMLFFAPFYIFYYFSNQKQHYQAEQTNSVILKYLSYSIPRNIAIYKKTIIYIIYTIVSAAMFLFLPFYSLVQWISRRFFKKTLFQFKKSKERNFLSKFIVERWLGENADAQQNRVFVYFLLPSLGAFVLFVMLPFVHGLYLSLTNWTGLNTGREIYIGFENYRTIFTDVGFGYSFIRTLLYSGLNIVIINVVAFLLALLVTQNLKFRNIYRAGFFLPNLIGGLVLGYIWQFIFNRALVRVGPLFEPSLIASGDTAIIGLMVVVTWQYAGYIMMIYIAAIQNIPQDLVEASTIDGANALQRLKAITMPLVAQAFTVAMFLTLVTSFKQYDTVMSLTQGGPSTRLPQWIGNLYGLEALPVVQSTNLIAINIFREAFSRYNMGLGQAKAIVFFFALLIVSLLQVYYNKRKEIEL
jgi:raffinose/stachyose/melibiose transport system permease protein